MGCEISAVRVRQRRAVRQEAGAHGIACLARATEPQAEAAASTGQRQLGPVGLGHMGRGRTVELKAQGRMPQKRDSPCRKSEASPNRRPTRRFAQSSRRVSP